MVLIELKSAFVSVIGTIFATFSEIALFSSLLTFNGFYACKRLQAGRAVSIRSHLRRTFLINVLSLLVFFSVEVVFAFFNDPSSFYRPEVHRCVRVTNSVQEGGDSIELSRSSDVFVECNHISDGNITQFAGNFSVETQQVQCSENAMYSFKYSEDGQNDRDELNLTRLDAELVCLETERKSPCLFVKQIGKLSYFSRLFSLNNLQALPEDMLFLETELHFKPPSDLGIFARRAIRTFLREIAGKAVLRRAVYSGAKEMSCAFDIRKGEATVVPLAVIIVLAIVWGMPIFFLLVSFFFRKRVFFDLNDPMHWGKQVACTDNVPLQGDMILQSDEEKKTLVVLPAATKEPADCNV